MCTNDRKLTNLLSKFCCLMEIRHRYAILKETSLKLTNGRGGRYSCGFIFCFVFISFCTFVYYYCVQYISLHVIIVAVFYLLLNTLPDIIFDISVNYRKQDIGLKVGWLWSVEHLKMDTINVHCPQFFISKLSYTLHECMLHVMLQVAMKRLYLILIL